jgi:hypothetical protein
MLTHADGARWSRPLCAPAGRRSDQGLAQMCCDGEHDVQARLDVPGHIRFVVMCARCGKEQREIGRQTYVPLPRLGQSPSTPGIAAEARLR